VTPLRRLRDLEDNPKLLTLKAWQTGDDEMQLKSYIEILRDGKAIYQGNADLLLEDALDEYTADEFLDLEELQLRNQGDALLPRGNYVVRVSTVAWDQELSSIAQGKFLNIDLRPIFGPRADDAREAIVSRAVDVSAEGDDELLVNFFEAGQAAADREQQSGSRRPSRLREPLMLAPIGTVGSTREALLSASVQHSFTEALKLQSIAGSSGRSEHLKIIVSEIYFPIDEDQLTEEGRLVLDNLARHLNQHPEQFAEVRGYANDVGDEAYNETLARRRAQRVLEYLVRQKMNAYRIKVADVDDEQLMTAPNQDPRLGRKVEIILKNRGM
jgi:outer membrane protein OmpA-like peptidoglycan-associated protein